MNDDDTRKLIEAMKQVFPTAEMIQRGFLDVDKRFNAIEMQLERLDAIILGKQQQRLEELETKMKLLRQINFPKLTDQNDQQPTQQEKNNP